MYHIWVNMWGSFFPSFFFFLFRPTWMSALLLIQRSSSPCSFVHIVWSMALLPGRIPPVPSGDRATVIFLLLWQQPVPIPLEPQEARRSPAVLLLRSWPWVLTLIRQHHLLSTLLNQRSRKGTTHTQSQLRHMGVSSLRSLWSTLHLHLLQRSHH